MVTIRDVWNDSCNLFDGDVIIGGGETDRNYSNNHDVADDRDREHSDNDLTLSDYSDRSVKELNR